MSRRGDTPSTSQSGDLTAIQSALITDDYIYEQLKDRHARDLPYTRLGSSTMIAVNPGKTLQLMGDTMAKEYAEQFYKDTSGKPTTLGPHIYETATKLHFALRRTGEDQSILLTQFTSFLSHVV
jgi:chitin synthase